MGVSEPYSHECMKTDWVHIGKYMEWVRDRTNFLASNQYAIKAHVAGCNPIN